MNAISQFFDAVGLWLAGHKALVVFSAEAAFGILGMIAGLVISSTIKPKLRIGGTIVLILVALICYCVGLWAYNYTSPLYPQISGAVWHTFHFQDNPPGWPQDKFWRIENEGNSLYLHSMPSDNGYHGILVPFPIPTDSMYANYAVEATVQIVDNNRGRGEFGVAIHTDGSDSSGYQGGISFPSSPSGVFLKINGPNTAISYTYNPPKTFVKYTIQVVDKMVKFFVDDGSGIKSYQALATKFSDPGMIMLWVRGGAKVNISSLTIMAS